MDKDIDYGALFGVDEGGNGQEVAEPAVETENGAEGGEDREVAVPGVEDIEAEAVGDTVEAGQSPAENARYAAARRKAEAERDAAIKAAKEEAEKEAAARVDEVIAGLSLSNPYTGAPIRTRAEYEAYRTEVEAEQKKSVLKKSGMSDEEFEAFVQSLPEVKAAKEARARAEDAAKAAKEREAKAKIEEQLREIGALDPSVKTLSDLTKTENYEKVYEYVQKGYTITDAYKLANFERLTGSAAAASRQAFLNAQAGKSHLSSTVTRGTGAITVPEDVKAEYRAFNPEATDAEIQRHYQRYAKR